MSERRILSINDTLKLDGQHSWFGMPVAQVLGSPSVEASGKGVLLVDVRVPFVLHDATTDDGQKVSGTLSMRIEVSPRNAAERDLVARKKSNTEQAAKLRQEKTDKAEQRIIEAVQNTAVDVAERIAKANKSPLATALEQTMAQNIGAMFGGKSLTSGQ